MEIFNQTDQELIFKTPVTEVKKNQKIGLFLIIFSLILLSVSIYRSGYNQLNCQKITENQISCQLIRKRLMSFYPKENTQINSISEVKLLEEKVIIVSENKNIYWSNYKIDQVKLNNWLNNPINENSQLILKNSNIFAQIVLSIILILFLLAGFQMLKNEGETLIFDKKIKRFTYQYKNLGFSQTFESPFNDIQKFEHKDVSSLDGSKYYVVNLVLNSKNILNLSQCILLYSSTNEQESLEIANQIKKFFNINIHYLK